MLTSVPVVGAVGKDHIPVGGPVDAYEPANVGLWDAKARAHLVA